MVKVKARLVKETALQISSLDKANYNGTLKDGLRINRQIKGKLIEIIKEVEEFAAKKDKMVQDAHKKLWDEGFKEKFEGVEGPEEQAKVGKEFQAAMDEAMKEAGYEKMDKEYKEMADKEVGVDLSKDDLEILQSFFKNNFKSFTTSLEVIGDICEGFGFDIEELG